MDISYLASLVYTARQIASLTPSRARRTSDSRFSGTL
jgi:hypothetical protein